MLSMDFAFFNCINQDKKGLVYRKTFLDRLTPVFFAPRLQKLICLEGIEARGCNVMLPLGPGNWEMLEQPTQEHIVDKSLQLAQAYHLGKMAVDRRLKPNLVKLSNTFSLMFGDNFIKALAYIILRETISNQKVKKIVVVGETDYFAEFINQITNFDTPVSIQTTNPSRYEEFAYRLLYERGCAVSTSCINPYNWDKGDLVLVFDREGHELMAATSSFYLNFSNHSRGYLPELEASLDRYGIDAGLSNLAPIMEYCLLSKAGFCEAGREQEKANAEREAEKFLLLAGIGDEMGLWDLFLDKGIWGHYNTIKAKRFFQV